MPKGFFELSSFQSFSPQVLTNETVLGQEKKVDIPSLPSSSITCHEAKLSTRMEAIKQLARHVFFIYREGENNVSESVVFFTVCVLPNPAGTQTLAIKGCILGGSPVILLQSSSMLPVFPITWSEDSVGFSFTSGGSSVRWKESLTAAQGLRSHGSTLTSVSKDLLSKHCPTNNLSLSSQVDSLFGQELSSLHLHFIMWGKWEPKTSSGRDKQGTHGEAGRPELRTGGAVPWEVWVTLALDTWGPSMSDLLRKGLCELLCRCCTLLRRNSGTTLKVCVVDKHTWMPHLHPWSLC